MATPFSEMVVGIDLGTQSTRCALMAPHQRMPDIVRNNFSLESTPSVVAFDEERRHVGEEGLLKSTSRPKWAANFLRMLFAGKSTSDLRMTYKIEDGALATPRGNFNFPQLLSMLFNVVLTYSRKAVNAGDDELPAKVVVSIPQCSPEAKQVIVAALGILGVRKESVLVCTDGTAAALCFRGRRFEGLAKTVGEARPVVVVDVGHGYNTVAIFKAAKEGIQLLGESSQCVGSASIDAALLNLMLAEIKAKHNEVFHPDEHSKQYSRLRKEATKGKEILSTIPKYSMMAEALTDTLDLKYDVATENVVQASAELIASLTDNANRVFELASLTPEDISEVETIGGGWRTPCVQDALKKLFNKDVLHTHLDPAQTVAQGCALAGLMKPPKQTASDAEMSPVESSPAPEGDAVMKDEEEKQGTPAAPSSPSGSPKADDEPEDSTNGVHFFSFDIAACLPVIDGQPVPDEDVARMREIENEIRKEEHAYNVRMHARNELESYFLQLPNVGFDAKLSDEVMDKLNAKVRELDDWLQGPEGEEATAEGFAKKLEEAKKMVQTEFSVIGEHLEKKRLEEEERERERQKAMQEARETKEPKTDPQRLKAAQERKDQGVVLFKTEDYAQAVTRFVQALTHLKDIYSLDNLEVKSKRDELALSCHLNIASASIKLKKWSHAIKNCDQALDYDASSAKALFRRGQARRQLAEFKEARADLKKALELSSGDKAIAKEVEMLDKQEADQKKKDKAMYAKMFGGM